MSSETQDEIDKRIREENDYLRSLHPLDPASFPFSPIPAPASPDAYWKLTAIRTGNLAKFPSRFFTEGPHETEEFSIPDFAFLLERVKNGKTERVLFELGLRNSSEHYNPTYIKYGELWGITFTPGVPRILESHNIPLDSISTIFFGHAHFDHIGNLAPFPTGVEVVVGPGSETGKELADVIDVPKETVEGRKVRVLNREGDEWEWKKVGALEGVDYFGDGSLFVLDTPGHRVGHVTALVRTSVEPPIYYLFGSDSAHVLSLVDSIDGKPQPKAGLFPLTYYDPSAHPEKLIAMHADLKVAYESMAKLGRMDREPNVQLFLAHDATMDRVLPQGDFVPLEGSLVEVQKFKRRDRNVVL